MPQHTAATRRRKGAPPPRQRDNTPLLIAGGAVAIIVVALLIFINVRQTGSTAAPINTSGRTWGNANAKVTIDEWSDFQ